MSFRRVLLVFIVLVIVGILVSGCGGGSSLVTSGAGVAPQATASPVGQWRTVFATTDGRPDNLNTVMDNSPGTTFAVWRFNANLTFALREYRQDGTVNAITTGTWSTAGSQLTLLIDSETEVLIYAIGGPKLLLKFTRAGHTYLITCVKAVIPTEHDPQAIGWWKAYGAQQNGAPASLAERFNFVPGATYVILNLKGSGLAAMTQYGDDGTVKATMGGSWATAPGGVMRLVIGGQVQWLLFSVRKGAVTAKNLSPDAGDSDITIFRSWLNGTWRAVSCRVDGVPASLVEHIYEHSDTTKMVARIRADGGMTMTEFKNGVIVGVQFGTWSINGSQLTFSFIGTGPYVVTPRNFTFSVSDEYGTTAVTFRRVS